jgi:carboxypeptidase T
MKKILLTAMICLFTFIGTQQAESTDYKYYWIKIEATDKFQRSLIANTGAVIEIVKDDYVIAYGSEANLNEIKKIARVIAASDLAMEQRARGSSTALDFPAADTQFHNFAELTTALQKLAKENPQILKISSIGKTVGGRDIIAVRITNDFTLASQKPAVIYMGGHHAREHLSVEIPLMWAQYLTSEYKKGNQRIVNLVNSRDIHIIPAVNPDGLEYDVSGTKYKLWRKNRSNNKDGTFGVDLNRNYGYKWGTGGSSKNTSDDTYMGLKPFSENETLAIKNYIDKHTNISTLLSVHTFSKLILYPWGHSNDPIGVVNDRAVHEKMAKKMATWNGYKPQQSSDLYIASGDTTDWSYGVHKIISFTFELDPDQSAGSSGSLIGGTKCEGFFAPGCGGFYPGQKQIQPTFTKNIEPFLYLLEYADNPYRVLNN